MATLAPDRQTVLASLGEVLSVLGSAFAEPDKALSLGTLLEPLLELQPEISPPEAVQELPPTIGHHQEGAGMV